MPSIQDDLLQRLADAGKDTEPFATYIAYACEGDEALAAAIDEGAETRHARESRGEPSPPVSRAYLKSISVRAFRGIGPERALKLNEGPGLTVVSGRNGSGKSSFAEAAELLFTNTCSRFTTPVASEGWRNRHEPNPPLIAAEVTVEGLGHVTFSRKWGHEATLASGETVVKLPDATVPIADTGWLGAATEYPPFLAYSQLGDMFDANSQLHDALVRGLGLDEYETVRTRVKNAVTDREKKHDDAKAVAKEAIAFASDVATHASDARLAEVIALLGARTWDTAAIDALVTYDDAADTDSTALKALATLTAPSADTAHVLADALRRADAESRRLAELSAGRSLQLAELLDAALAFTVSTRDNACPVCDTPGVIHDDWRARTTDVSTKLRADASDAKTAAEELKRARARALQFCAAPPRALADAAPAGIDTAGLLDAWRAFATPVADEAPETLALRIENGVRAIADRLAPVVAAARAELVRREDIWRPVANKVRDWLPLAVRAQASAEARKHLQKAAAWLRDEIVTIRAERFAPIEDRAREYWATLRMQSNVELCAVKVVGTRTRRAVELEVKVDGDGAKALSVMSQGELNSLALSLFLPRATMPDTPFGFVLIDDPVQALDPSKVEGLARVLGNVARTHQVIVFTHDDRLPEAVRRLAISATFVDITRKDRSIVDIRRTHGPVQMLMDDAVAVTRTEQMPDAIKLRLVPNFCRSALEAACHEVVRARRLARGDRHADVEDALTSAIGLRKLMALALMDDADRGGEVESALTQGRSPAYKTTFRACLDGAHGDYTGELQALIDGTDALVKLLRGRGHMS